jgi:phosphatidate cytidylyltransferase
VPGRADTAPRWTDLRKRVVSAGVLAPLAIAGVWIGGLAFQVLTAAATVGLTLEWLHLCRRDVATAGGLVTLASVLAAALCAAAGQGLAALVVLAAGVVLAGLLSGTAALPLGIPYLGLGAVALIWLRADPVAGRGNVIFLLVLIWASDIGAYVTGRLIGGPRLAPRISPGKTWSGAVGGLLLAIGIGLLMGLVLQPDTTPLRLACIAAALGIIAQAGDLTESRIKRYFGVKDSGRLIPGHGGLLDRLDALLFAAPAAAMLALLAGRGVVLWQ